MSNTFELEDRQLIEKFTNGSNQLLASNNLRLEVSGNLSQLTARNRDTVAIMYLDRKPRTVIVKNNSPFTESIDSSLVDRNFVFMGDANRSGFTEYQHYVIPAGYRILSTDPSILWKRWWPTERFHNKQRFNMNILVGFKDNWYPIRNINVHGGVFTIDTIAGQLVLKRESKVIWLAQITQESLEISTLSTDIETAANKNQVEPELNIPIQPRYSSADLALKIQHKQAETSPELARKLMKELEQQLQEQTNLAIETEEKFKRAEHRATIAEQRLKMVHNYLAKRGINPQEIYHPN